MENNLVSNYLKRKLHIIIRMYRYIRNQAYYKGILSPKKYGNMPSLRTTFLLHLKVNVS